ncbi:hypothetical protein BDZ45DRAFT_744335 [Acephala macrosclerotiorum]|nr:hypothetical protein BDZ45DRAFT_744335 [Acephala macrosclerotiorum]
MAAVVTLAAPPAAPPPGFPQFPQLPNELQAAIWAQADTDSVIKVGFKRTPTYKRDEGSRPAHVGWAYKCGPRQPHPQLRVSAGSRAAYTVRHPQTLRLNRGPSVYFSSLRDAVYFDGLSFFNLWHYVARHRPILRQPSPLCSLQGFVNIRRLGHHHPNNLTSNKAGLARLRIPAENVLTGLTRIHRLGAREIFPPGTNSPGQANWPMITRIRARCLDQLAQFRVSTNRWGRDRFSPLQKAVIARERNGAGAPPVGGVPGDVIAFNGAILAALNIPE